MDSNKNKKDMAKIDAIVSDKLSKEIEELEDKKPARYKIEVLFGSKRSIINPSKAVITVWEKDNYLGEGLAEGLMLQCDSVDKATFKKKYDNFGEVSKRDKVYGCGHFISTKRDFVVKIINGVPRDVAICPHCNREWVDTSRLTENRFGVWTPKNLAKILYKYFILLDYDADIYCRYFEDDIRYKMMSNQYGEDKAQELKGLTIYPKNNIIKDTSTGVSIEKKFEDFLKS